MFHFPDEVDWTWSFRFDKKWIEYMHWASISPAAKAVLLVIGCHCDESGGAFPGEDTIAALSGRTNKIVRQGIKDLERLPGFFWEHYLTRRGKQGKQFKVDLPPKGEKGRIIYFKKGLLESGIWSELKPTGQALYLVLRYFAHYDILEDETSEDPSEFLEDFKKRRWDLCDAEVGQLAKYAGIDRRSIAEAIANLQKNFLLEPYVDGNGEKMWKVFIFPPNKYLPSYLNQKLQKGSSR